MSPLELRAVRSSTRRKYAGIQRGATVRIRNVAGLATDLERAQARDWYPAAAADIRARAEAAGIPADLFADVVALTSPRCSWHLNIDAAETIVEAFLEGRRDVPWGPLPESTWRAYGWLDGTNESGAGFGPKTTSFAANLKGDLEQVTVDVWATRAAVGRDEPSGAYEYGAIARAYRTVAAELGLPPAELQALVWIIVRGSADVASPAGDADLPF